MEEYIRHSDEASLIPFLQSRGHPGTAPAAFVFCLWCGGWHWLSLACLFSQTCAEPKHSYELDPSCTCSEIKDAKSGGKPIYFFHVDWPSAGRSKEEGDDEMSVFGRSFGPSIARLVCSSVGWSVSRSLSEMSAVGQPVKLLRGSFGKLF